jgi:SH3-like domain-containing protein
MDGQGEAEDGGKALRRIACFAGAAATGLLLAGASAAAERQTPSGLPVPRYVSLKFDRVNARAGPGDDHRLLWVYKVKGLPVQVVAETSEWRRVCDPEGSLVWVHKRTTDGRRTAMNTKEERVTLLKRPRPDARAAAFLNPRALATLDKCEKGWCRVRADGVAGWAKEGDLWGTAEAPQCR